MKDPRGFTLIELMIVVAIIAILAFVVVPQFMKQGSQAKGTSEVTAYFAEISSKEQRYYSDNNTYLTASACPTAPSRTQQSATCFNSTPWTTMGFSAPESMISGGASVPAARCSYSVVTGNSGTNPSPPAPFVLPSTPANSWYYILAQCDMDGNGTYSSYLQSSLDSTIQKNKEGE